jgi:hypothetical protein
LTPSPTRNGLLRPPWSSVESFFLPCPHFAHNARYLSGLFSSLSSAASFEQDWFVQTEALLLAHLKTLSRCGSSRPPWSTGVSHIALTSPFAGNLTDYQGDDTDYEAARSYFKDRFVRLNRSTKKEIYTHVSMLAYQCKQSQHFRTNGLLLDVDSILARLIHPWCEWSWLP